MDLITSLIIFIILGALITIGFYIEIFKNFNIGKAIVVSCCVAFGIFEAILGYINFLKGDDWTIEAFLVGVWIFNTILNALTEEE